VRQRFGPQELITASAADRGSPVSGPRGRDTGLSLIELSIAAAVMVLVIGLATAFGLSARRDDAATQQRQSRIDQAGQALTWIDRALGTLGAVQLADPSGPDGHDTPTLTATPSLVAAGADKIEFIGGSPDGQVAAADQAAARPVRITIERTGAGVLQGTVQRSETPGALDFCDEARRGTTSCPASRFRTETLARGVGPEPFTYFDAAGAETGPAAPGDLDALAGIAAVEVRLVVTDRKSVV
jgi:hypothetical protein